MNALPTYQHKAYGMGKRVCGDTTHTSYVDDDVYGMLPKCEICFSDTDVQQVVHEIIEEPVHVHKSNRIVLRDAEKER